MYATNPRKQGQKLKYLKNYKGCSPRNTHYISTS